MAETRSVNSLHQRCLDAGMKMTEQRRVILQVLGDSEDHPSVEMVYQRAKEMDNSVSIATVYRTLQMLEQMDLIQRHDFNENHSRFEANLEHHHHLIDVDSGEVIEFQNDEIEELKVRIAAELGFDLVDHRLELYGRKRKG